MQHPNKNLMERLIILAKENYVESGHAVAALVVKDDEVVAEAVTTVARDKDSTCHAEINALRAAMKKLDSRTLVDCYLYTTFEPCPMCTSAAVWAKMKGIVYGASREDRTEHYPWRIMIPASEILERSTPKLELVSEFMREECRELLYLVP